MKKAIFILSNLFGLGVTAQTLDSTISLNQVNIHANRFDQFNTGTKQIKLDSVLGVAYQTQTLADLLSSQSQVFIKSYGQGLASSSFRGAAAEHTAVLWKGFNLQSPLNGQVDLSLIANDLYEQVSIQYGGNGALFGSGAVGGTIQLQSKPKFNSGVKAQIGLEMGSFGRERAQLSMSYGNKYWYQKTKFFWLGANNDFTFTNTNLADNPSQKQTNASIEQRAFITEHSFLLKPNQQINLNFWYQKNNREIPPTLSVPNAKSYQLDETYRTTLEWKMSGQRLTHYARTAYFDEQIQYIDPQNPLFNGSNHSKTSITELESRWNLGNKQYVNIGLNNTFVNAYSNGYGGWLEQNRIAAFCSYKIENLLKHLTLSMSLREEYVSANRTPIMPNIGFEWRFSESIQVFGNVTRSFRVATFNEMYWRGNSMNINPELGWGQELSVQAHKQLFKPLFASITLTGFNRNIDNWIVWQPSGIDWAPFNLKSVWSRGLEAHSKWIYKLGGYQLQYTGSINFILSTNKESYNGNDAIIGKQLIYVPLVTQQHQLVLKGKSGHIGLLHNYTGLRYTASDNSDWLNDYYLLNLVVGKELNIYHFNVVLSGQLNNLFNTQYQAIADRPMPGRNYLINLTFKI